MLEKNDNEEILSTDVETSNFMSGLNQELPINNNVSNEPVSPVPVTPVVEQPVVEELAVPVVEQPPVTSEPTVPVAPVVEQPVVEEPAVPVIEQPPVTSEPTVPVAPVVEQPVVEESSRPKGSSSVLKVVLMIILILAITLGGLYVYKEYFSKPEEKEKPEVLTKENKETSEVFSWNGVYRLENSTTQLLLIDEVDKKASLMIAKEEEKDGKKELEFYHHYRNQLDDKEGKLIYTVENQSILEISNNGSVLVVSYVGEEDKKDDYADIVGNYTKIKEAKIYDISEFFKE